MSNRVDLLRYDKPQKTCKDCLHYEVGCSFTPTDLDCDVFDYCKRGIADEIPNIQERCESFKDKTEYAPVVHGRWIDVEFKNITTYYLYRCSECDHPESFKHKYCPNCGKPMDGRG